MLTKKRATAFSPETRRSLSDRDDVTFQTISLCCVVLINIFAVRTFCTGSKEEFERS